MSDEELLEEFCLALRDVGVSEWGLPDREEIRFRIERAKELHALLEEKKIPYKSRIELLTHETKWQMARLLQDTLAYPASLPYVYELDGVRRFFRCWLRKKAEHPVAADLLEHWCATCVESARRSIHSLQPLDQTVLFRTFNPECRCAHADSDTVLILSPYDQEDMRGYCELCLDSELSRRHKSLSESP